MQQILAQRKIPKIAKDEDDEVERLWSLKDLIIPIPFLRICLAIIWIFRHFPLLLKCVYNDLAFVVPSIKDAVPFCAFQHLHSSILNAVLLGRAFIVDKFITKKSLLDLIPVDMIIPKLMN